MECVVLGLGSNKNYGGKEPVALLAEACAALDAVLKDCVFSSVYKTGALYVTDQDDFYNMVVRGMYEGTPRTLLEDVHIIEGNLGRNRAQEFRNGPRPLDIDIELFGNIQVHESDLIIPHERLLERAFVLKPLVEILRKSADGRSRDTSNYEHALEAVEHQRIEKFLDSADLKALVAACSGTSGARTSGSRTRKA